MTKLRFVLVALCIALLGTMPFIVTMPKSTTADASEVKLSQMRPEISTSLQQALHLSAAHNYDAALKVVDDLSAVPDKTNLEAQATNQVRDWVLSSQRRP